MQKINHNQKGMALVQALGAILLLSIISAALLTTQSKSIKGLQSLVSAESSKDFVDICVKSVAEAVSSSTPLPQDRNLLIQTINAAIAALPTQIKGISTLANLQMKLSSQCTYVDFGPGVVNAEKPYIKVTAIQDDGVNRVHYEVIIQKPL